MDRLPNENLLELMCFLDRNERNNFRGTTKRNKVIVDAYLVSLAVEKDNPPPGKNEAFRSYIEPSGCNFSQILEEKVQVRRRPRTAAAYTNIGPVDKSKRMYQHSMVLVVAMEQEHFRRALHFCRGKVRRHRQRGSSQGFCNP